MGEGVGRAGWGRKRVGEDVVAMLVFEEELEATARASAMRAVLNTG